MTALLRLLCILGALTVPAVAKAQGIDRDAAIDTEHIFGFTEGADIGGKGEEELENTTIGRLGRPGSFAAFTNEMAFRYGLAEHFRASFGALANYHSIRSVPDLTDRTALNFSGLSSEFRWQLLERVASPVDLTLSFSPEWRRINDTSGEAVESYASPSSSLRIRLSFRTRCSPPSISPMRRSLPAPTAAGSRTTRLKSHQPLPQQ